MREYTYSISGNSCMIRDARTGASIRQLSRGGEKINDVMISGDTASLVMESGRTYVFNIANGVCIRQV